jgi:hypothetical protein
MMEVDIAVAEQDFISMVPCDSAITLPNDIREVEVFALLYWRFGEPNGFHSRVLPPGGDPDAPWKWQYMFRLPNGWRIAIQRSWLALEMVVWGAKVGADDALSLLRHNLSVHQTEIRQTIEALERWRLLINPFHRHASMAEVANHELVKLQVPRVSYPPAIACTRKEQKRYLNSIKEHLEAARREMFFCMSLVTESAFMAESFLNLAITLFRNEALQRNDSLFKDIRRGKWQEKLKSLSIYCCELQHSPDLKATPVRDAEWLFGLRNRLAHSHPDASDLGVAEMWFAKKVPILPVAVPFDSFQMATDQILPTREDALRALPTAKAFIEYVTSLFTPDAQHGLKMAADTNPLGFNEKTGRFCVPFSSWVGRFFMHDEPPS